MALWNRRRRRDVTIEDLVNYGTSSKGFDGRSVDVDAAAKDLNVPKSAVRKAISSARSAFSNTVLRAFTGRNDADVSKSAGLRGMLQAAYGQGPRGAAVNSKAAAQDLGVSQQTVRRWAAGTQQPSPQHLKSLKDSARRTTSTAAGRKGIADEFRRKAAGKGKRKLRIEGFQGPGGDYMRNRTIAFDVADSDIDSMLRAYEEGGPDGFRDWLTEKTGSAYLPDWEFGSIEDFELE